MSRNAYKKDQSLRSSTDRNLIVARITNPKETGEIAHLSSKHAPRDRLSTSPNSAAAAHTSGFKTTPAAASSSTAPSVLRTRVPSQHEHGFPPFFVELFEKEQRLFFQTETAFLVSVHNVEGVLPPVVVDVVAFESLFCSKGTRGQ